MGNLDAKRDWGYAPEYAEVMWRMLQQEEPDDYVIGTGESHTVKEFLETAFSYAGLDWEKHVEIDPKYFRPTEVDSLEADCMLAREKLNWEPRIGFGDLAKIMVDSDMERAGLTAPGVGKRSFRRGASAGSRAPEGEAQGDRPEG